MKNKQEKNNNSLKMAAIIVSGVLGFVTIIGIFWGTEGIKNMGIGIGILLLLILFIGFNTSSPYLEA